MVMTSSPGVRGSDTIDQEAPPVAPLSRLARRVAGVSLVLAGVTNGLSQYLTEVVTGGHDSFSDQIRWGADNPGVHQAEQFALVVSMLFLPIGLLGLAQVSRWRAPRLTAVGLALVAWGMWGFHNVVAMGYTAGSVAPGVIGVDAAVALNDGLVEHTGTMVVALLPHLVGSFVGLILLSIACWRSRSFPRIPLVLLVAFLVWDFLLPSFGPLEAHLLLFVALGWLGVHVIRMDDAAWRGSRVAHEADARPILQR